jgi:hypothetical protein
MSTIERLIWPVPVLCIGLCVKLLTVIDLGVGF